MDLVERFCAGWVSEPCRLDLPDRIYVEVAVRVAVHHAVDQVLVDDIHDQDVRDAVVILAILETRLHPRIHVAPVEVYV